MKCRRLRGKGLTGGGTLLPMSDVIRLARHANHYLAIFDKGNTLALYHTKRLASPDQRIVLYAKDRGCTAPGCDVSGYYCEVHHVEAWATTQRTDVNQLTLDPRRRFAGRMHSSAQGAAYLGLVPIIIPVADDSYRNSASART